MILVDKELRERIHTEPSLITGCLSEEQIGAVSCDLTVSDIVNQKFRSGRFDLRPQAVVFVKTNEALCMMICWELSRKKTLVCGKA